MAFKIRRRRRRNRGAIVRLALLVFAAAAPEFAQGLHFGVKAGVPITAYFDTGQTGDRNGSSEYSAATRRYTVGVSAEWRLNRSFGLELDALYKRMGYVGIVNTFSSSNGISTISADRKSTRLNSSHIQKSRMPSSA